MLRIMFRRSRQVLLLHVLIDSASTSVVREIPLIEVSRAMRRGCAAVPSPAMVPIRVSREQGFTKSLNCPTPDQPSWLPLLTSKLPDAAGIPLTVCSDSNPALSA